MSSSPSPISTVIRVNTAVFDVDIEQNGSNLFGIEPDRLYNVVNIAAYTALAPARDQQTLWGDGILGQDLLDQGIFVSLNAVPTEDFGENGWDQAPFETQYLRLLDVTPDEVPPTIVATFINDTRLDPRDLPGTPPTDQLATTEISPGDASSGL